MGHEKPFSDSFPGHPPYDLIGRRARYQGELYEVLEILKDERPALVLQNCSHTTIQPDQHGEAHRRVPETITVPLAFSRDTIDFVEMELELLEAPRTESSPA